MGKPFYTAEQVRSRLGISTYVLYGQMPLQRKAMELIAKAGIAAIEILDQREDFQEEAPRTMREIAAACRESGVSVTSFHSRSVDFHELGLNAEIERSKRVIDHLLDIGGTVWGTHVRIMHKETRLGYEALAKYCEGENMKLVIENLGNQSVHE